MRVLTTLCVVLYIPAVAAEMSLKERMTAAAAHGVAKARADARNTSNSSRRLKFTPGDILPFDFELEPEEMQECMTHPSVPLMSGTGGDCFSICFFTTWLCEGIFDITDNICDAFADIGSAGIGAAITAGIAAAIPGVLWDLPMAATLGLLAKELIEPLFDRVVERVCQPSDALGDQVALTDECMDSMKYFGSSFDNIVELAGTDLNGMLTGNIQDCCSTVMRRRRRLGYCSNVESRRRCMVDMNPTDYDECYNPEDELLENYEEGLTIAVESASDLPDDSDWPFGEIDPYVTCEDEDGASYFETEALDGAGSNPTWHSGNTGWLEDWEKGEDVLCEIWDEDTGRPDDELGSFVIPASALDGLEDQALQMTVPVDTGSGWGWRSKSLRGGNASQASNMSKARLGANSAEATVRVTKGNGGSGNPRCPGQGRGHRDITCTKETTMTFRCTKCMIYSPCVEAKPRVDKVNTASFGQVEVCAPRYDYIRNHKASDLVIPLQVVRGVEDVLAPAQGGRVDSGLDGLWQWADQKCTEHWAPTKGTPKEDCLLLINPRPHRSQWAMHIHNKPVGIHGARVPKGGQDKVAKQNFEAIKARLKTKGVCSRTSWPGTPDFQVLTGSKCSCWAKTIKADLSSGVFTRAFDGPAKGSRSLENFGLMVFWMDCGTALTQNWKRVLLVSSGCTMEPPLLEGGKHRFKMS